MIPRKHLQKHLGSNTDQTEAVDSLDIIIIQLPSWPDEPERLIL